MRNTIKVFSPQDLAKKIAIVIGTRPGIIMFSPIIKKIKKRFLPHIIIHTGQHYSPNMDQCFFDDLNLPSPDYHLNDVCKNTTHGEQTAAMLVGIEKILLAEKPAIVMVGGDANTNLAGALAARKLGIKVAHLEAGERSFDWSMPEEHNRRIIDHISDLLFVTGKKSRAHLEREFVQGKIFETGNTIVDASVQNIDIAAQKSILIKQLELTPKQYILFTTHREENVDNKIKLSSIFDGLSLVAEELKLPIIFPAHPRTLKRMEQFQLTAPQGVTQIDPVGYLDFIQLLKNAALVVTDSGGVQQEACIFQTPAVTIRENTEWVETLTLGANILVGTSADKILEACKKSICSGHDWSIPFGDGNASDMILNILSEELN